MPPSAPASLEAVAARAVKGFPTYGELAGWLAEWWREHRPAPLALPRRRRSARAASRTPEEIEHVSRVAAEAVAALRSSVPRSRIAGRSVRAISRRHSLTKSIRCRGEETRMTAKYRPDRDRVPAVPRERGEGRDLTTRDGAIDFARELDDWWHSRGFVAVRHWIEAQRITRWRPWRKRARNRLVRAQQSDQRPTAKGGSP